MENNKMPTASEFLPKNNNGKYSRNEVEKAMIEFAFSIKNILKNVQILVFFSYICMNKEKSRN